MSIRDLERFEKLAIEKAKLAVFNTNNYQALQKRIEKNLDLIEKEDAETTAKIAGWLSGGVVASRTNMSKIQTRQSAAIAAIQKLQADVKHSQDEQKRQVSKAVHTAVEALLNEKGAAYVLALHLKFQNEADNEQDQRETPKEEQNEWGGE